MLVYLLLCSGVNIIVKTKWETFLTLCTLNLVFTKTIEGDSL